MNFFLQTYTGYIEKVENIRYKLTNNTNFTKFLVCLHGEYQINRESHIICDNRHTWCFHKIIF